MGLPILIAFRLFLQTVSPTHDITPYVAIVIAHMPRKNLIIPIASPSPDMKGGVTAAAIPQTAQSIQNRNCRFISELVDPAIPSITIQTTVAIAKKSIVWGRAKMLKSSSRSIPETHAMNWVASAKITKPIALINILILLVNND